MYILMIVRIMIMIVDNAIDLSHINANIHIAHCLLPIAYCLLPIVGASSVRLLLDAHAAGEGKGEELQLHGTECANVTLVGVVENLVQQATMLEFTINDASGRVKVYTYSAQDS